MSLPLLCAALRKPANHECAVLEGCLTGTPGQQFAVVFLTATLAAFSVAAPPPWGRGQLEVAAGLACLLDCFARFALEGRGTPAPVAQTEVLVASGLYRFVRNPMYVSLLIIVSGQALLFGQARLFAYAGVMLVAFHLFVLFYEEPTLRRRFGGSYETYYLHVGRWWPRLTPWRAGQVRQPPDDGSDGRLRRQLGPVPRGARGRGDRHGQLLRDSSVVGGAGPRGALTPLYVKTLVQAAWTISWRARKSVMTRW